MPRYDANKGDRFFTYAEDGELLRGIVWADEERGEYAQFYVLDFNGTNTTRKALHIGIKWCRGKIRVVPIGKDTLLHRTDLIRYLVHKYGWTRGAEVGVSKGRTTFMVAKACPKLILYAVDYWPGVFEKSGRVWKSEHRQAVAHKRNNVILIEKPSVEAAREISDESLDFVFIDADHTEESCRADIQVWFPKVKPTGMLLGHDSNWDTVLAAVKSEFKEFNLFQQDSIWWVWKDGRGDQF